MKRIITLALGAVMSFAFIACDQPAANNANTSNANTNANAPAAAEKKDGDDMKTSLVEMETKAWEAFKNKDGKFFEEFLADSFVSTGPDGVSGKSDSVKMIAENPCEVKSYSITDTNVVPLSDNAALLTAKVASEYTCEGKPGPSPVHTATLFIKNGDKWQAALHQERAAADAKPADTPAPAPAKVDGSDSALADELSKTEKMLWETWSKADVKGFESGISKSYGEMDENGYRDRAKSLETVSPNPCKVTSHSQENFYAKKVSDTVAVLMYRANLDAVCDGKPAPKKMWSSSVYIKEGDKWINTFYTSNPIS